MLPLLLFFPGDRMQVGGALGLAQAVSPLQRGSTDSCFLCSGGTVGHLDFAGSYINTHMWWNSIELGMHMCAYIHTHIQMSARKTGDI